MLAKGMTKNHSSLLYGVAILFMLFHHLFSDNTSLWISLLGGGGGAKNCVAL